MMFDASSEAALQAHIDAGTLTENHYLEAKREIPSGAGANLELARDLASLAIDGGALLVGFAEDKAKNTYALAPAQLDGLAERVEQVAQSRIAPRLTIRCRKILSRARSDLGYLVVEVPPSPEAPHMVDGRYYSRGDTTKHVLADSDVRRLNDQRLDRRARFVDRLAAEVERDPTPADARSEAHLFILSSPSTGRPEMLHGALDSAGQTLRSWAQEAILRGAPGARLPWPARGEFTPDIDGQLEAATRANGVGLYTWEVGPNRTPRPNGNNPVRERRLLDLEIDDDGTTRLFCSAATVTRGIEGGQPQRLMITPLVAALMVRVVRSAVQVSDVIPYIGSWDIGLRLTNLRGAVSSRLAENLMASAIEYTEDGYEASGQFLVDELSSDERAVVTRLCGRLYRGLGEDLNSWGA